MTETLSPTLPADVEEQVERVLKAAFDRGLTLVTAESCTGGLLASLLTDIDGCAHAFERGFVTYADAAKAQQLDVPAELLKFHGAVSAPVAEAMAAGALARSEGDIALAVTGFAGRGAAHEEPGLVFIAAARRGGAVEVKEVHFGAWAAALSASPAFANLLKCLKRLSGRRRSRPPSSAVGTPPGAPCCSSQQDREFSSWPPPKQRPPRAAPSPAASAAPAAAIRWRSAS
ncbi:CinA family protein [Phenylobacterium sp.]|jgi:nicotinamide-nucleotide amidase|uniref:CinA family protein n=1 Tax=Phenylobacterium sp. TaxID=1871053 RepID=UPI002E3432CD|nr:CinA family protein [Phenylobacterium sp.]HEX3364984.1 CinA family protein [Phenylobacterium sp.]